MADQGEGKPTIGAATAHPGGLATEHDVSGAGRGAFAASGRIVQGIISLVLASALGCSHHPTGPSIVPPSTIAPLTYASVVWSPTGDSLGFYHIPVDSMWYDPTTGNAGYSLDYALAGWWSAPVSGGPASWRLADLIEDASVHVSSNRVAAVVQRQSGPTVIVAPLEGATPDMARAVELGFLGFAPRWNGQGDSLLFNIYQSKYIAASDGSGYMQRALGMGPPSWDPLAHAVLASYYLDSGSGWHAVIRRIDLNTGASEDLISSTTSELSWPLYSPDGEHIAYIVRPAQGGEGRLWVAGPRGENPRELFSEAVKAQFAWAPDSRRVAVIVYRPHDFGDTNNRIVIVDSVTGKAERLMLEKP